jgi:hypothetical protein
MKTIKMISLALAASVSGCATIVSDSNYPVVLSSEPSGASFVIKNQYNMPVYSGHTPTTVMLKSNKGFFQGASYTVEVNKDGYLSAQSSISSSIDPWWFGNILFGGFVGFLVVDPITGAMFKLEDQTFLTLTSIPEPTVVNRVE